MFILYLFDKFEFLYKQHIMKKILAISPMEIPNIAI